MNNAKKMPDAYAKSTGSNLYKLFQIANLMYGDTKADFESINGSRDINYAYGETLDRYGEMVGQKRGGSTDEQYRLEILNRIGKNLSAGDCNSTIQLIAQMFSVPVENVGVSELDNCSVMVSGISIAELESIGFTGEEAHAMIEGMLPAGVALAIAFEGTFRYGEHEGETSTESGYNYGTYGGIGAS